MNKDVPAEVYKNLFAMLKYRGIETKQTLDMDKFHEDMMTREYTTIVGTRDVARKIVGGDDAADAAADGAATATTTVNVLIIQFNEKSMKGLKTPDFKKVLTDTMKNLEGKCEIMTVTEEPINTHLQKAVRDFVDENRYIENHAYPQFIIEYPKHELMDKHEVVPQDELDTLMFQLKTQPNKLPKILVNDTAAIWIGARPGQVVRIYRSSETAGTAVAYRLVKRVS